MSPVNFMSRRTTISGLAALIPIGACQTIKPPSDPVVFSTVSNGLNIVKDLIDPGRPNRPASTIYPNWVTVHSTSNTTRGADASAHARFVKNVGFYTLPSGRRNYVSWHYTVDDQNIYQHLPLQEKGFHAGRGNTASLGIEICMNEGIDQDRAIRKTAKLVAQSIFDLKLPLRNVVQHHYWTSKNCPVVMRTRDYSQIDWLFFQRIISEELIILELKFGKRVIKDVSNIIVSDAPDEPDIDHELLAAQII